MIGSAVTALLFVGFMVFGIYAVNVRSVDPQERIVPSIDEGFLTELDALVDLDKDSVPKYPSGTKQQSNFEKFLDRLRGGNSEDIPKPSTIFPTTPTTPTIPVTPPESSSPKTTPPTQYLPTIPPPTGFSSPTPESSSWWDDLSDDDDWDIEDDFEI